MIASPAIKSAFLRDQPVLSWDESQGQLIDAKKLGYFLEPTGKAFANIKKSIKSEDSLGGPLDRSSAFQVVFLIVLFLSLGGLLSLIYYFSKDN